MASPLVTQAGPGQDRRTHKQRLIAHSRERSVALGPCMRLQFEDEHTDGSHWKATLAIELPDTAERDRELPRLNEAAQRLYVELPRHPRVFAELNEPAPDRHLPELSAMHHLRFQFPPPLRIALLAGAGATLGCAHDEYAFRRVIPMTTLEHLRCDLAAAQPD